jgi:hypothetical protein
VKKKSAGEVVVDRCRRTSAPGHAASSLH